MADLLTWEEVVEQLSGECIVLLGNGFSRSYCNSNFNQREILSKMPSLQGVPDVIDIEQCILETQQKVQETSTERTVPKGIIDKWIKDILHKEFINTLYDMMPKSLMETPYFTNEKLAIYKKFFNNFSKIFTLNYDPLLYWMVMHFLNYGNEDYVKCYDLNEQLKNTDKDSDNFNKLKKNVDKFHDKCMKTIRGEMYEKYLKDKDYYRMLISCKNKPLIEKSIYEATEQFSIKWDKLADTLYNTLEEVKEDDEIFEQESQALDKIATSAFNSQLQMIETNKEELQININDGFNGETWQPNMAQTIFYLHGAFHFMEKDGEVLKVKAEANNKMVSNIKKKWDEGFEPLTVLESTPEKKKARIAQSRYLTRCFDELKTAKGNLVTHGLSFMSSDQHIIEAINSNNNLDKIYIGVYGTISEDIKKAFENNPKVSFFNTEGMFSL